MTQQSHAYFIHATPSELNSNHVIKKFSLKYYFVIYLADGIISSEAPMHCNILQSSNKILKDNICHKKFVFLQHGITYLKSQTRASSYAKGKEAHPNVIITSSDKESRVIQRMLGIPKERITKTGMAIFDDLSYGHLLNKPQENILVMFTWRPYELDVEPELTTLFKIISQVTSILSKVPHSCNVRVCLHPKIRKLFDENICGFNIYDGKISEVLSWANLVITDYSSICYNSFYQGAGVLFYQPDLIEFENHVGKLIPDLDEYIGHRVDNYDDLNDLITDSFNTDGFIDIKKFRNEGFERRYESINEFNDSLAKSRILNDLINRKVI
ncbi:CDP-glycerol glycerophosphotransferase family protein [Vibrio lentus]|uniref:CDP-glycerol glycerophosphotransferase family protein n=1 Tax=Vibrio lentus TaxID=136468 RepID=UPI000C851A75